VTAVDLHLGVGPTPVALLVVVIALALVGAAAFVAVGVAAPRLVDRRWPATQPLNPSELAWALVGQYVEATFRGLELELAKELATEMEEVAVPSGTVIIRQGDPATHFFILKAGQIEVSQRVELPSGVAAEQVIRQMSAGSFFGEVAILRRTACTATVRAVSDCVLLRLPAADFITGAARSAADEHVLLRAVDHYIAEDRARAKRLVAAEQARGRR